MFPFSKALQRYLNTGEHTIALNYIRLATDENQIVLLWRPLKLKVVTTAKNPSK